MDPNMQDIIERILGMVSELGFFLPIAIFALANLFSRKNKSQPAEQQRPQRTTTQSPRPQRTPRPTIQPMPSFPNGPATWMDMGSPPPAPMPKQPAAPRERSNWGSTFDANDAAHDDRALRWGSAFDANDVEKRDHTLQWGSAFDHERGRTKWGWDDAEWGSGFAKKKDSEPRITIG
jgi:type IV secretory pathway VirB10-like protein